MTIPIIYLSVYLPIYSILNNYLSKKVVVCLHPPALVHAVQYSGKHKKCKSYKLPQLKDEKK